MKKNDDASKLKNAPFWVRDLYENLKPLVTYKEIANHSSYKRNTLANLSSQGLGPDGGFLLKRKKVYPRLNVVLWLWEIKEEYNR